MRVVAAILAVGCVSLAACGHDDASEGQPACTSAAIVQFDTGGGPQWLGGIYSLTLTGDIADNPDADWCSIVNDGSGAPGTCKRRDGSGWFSLVGSFDDCDSNRSAEFIPVVGPPERISCTGIIANQLVYRRETAPPKLPFGANTHFVLSRDGSEIMSGDLAFDYECQNTACTCKTAYATLAK